MAMEGTSRREVTAHHEAAQAVVLYRMCGFSGAVVTIVPNPDKGTVGTAHNVAGDGFNEDHVRGEVVSCCAGGYSHRKLGAYVRESNASKTRKRAAAHLRVMGWEQRETELRVESRSRKSALAGDRGRGRRAARARDAG
jgi:hypothetical protein